MSDYGHLSVTLGPMFAGKTTELLHQARMAQECRLDYIVMKPSIDDRYSTSEVVSHDGVSLPCLTTSCLPAFDDHRYDVILVDEVQFFGMEVIPWITSHLEKSTNIRAYGLDMDWKGDPFIVSGALAAMADHVNKQHARCAVCGARATKTMKKDGQGRSVEIGAGDKYEPRCNAHWRRPSILRSSPYLSSFVWTNGIYGSADGSVLVGAFTLEPQSDRVFVSINRNLISDERYETVKIISKNGFSDVDDAKAYIESFGQAARVLFWEAPESAIVQ